MDEIGQLLAKKVERVTPATFDELALEIFRYQAACNSLYADYIRLLHIKPETITKVEQIPFLPIQFFKTHDIQTGKWTPETVFTSSGTTGQTPSRHLVRDLDFYLRNTRRGFEHFYGKLEDYCFLALLPSYLERSGSSLVAMVDYFIRQSKYEQSGFFLHDTDRLVKTLQEVKKKYIPTVLIGVSFALWDLAEQCPMDLKGIIVMETGGTKGRRRNLIRKELHKILEKGFNVNSIHSEYGMTELLSQSYFFNKKLFSSPTIRTFARQITDPLTNEKYGKTGVLNIIDLANFNTISFIATEDLGRVYADHSFEVLGRLDNSDIRGCNLMVM